MERVEYDPEIDPSIREEREAAVRERELTDRIRLEIERYVADNRDRSEGTDEVTDGGPSVLRSNAEEIADGGNVPLTPKSPREIEREQKEREREKREAEREKKRQQRAERSATRRKAIGSVFTGSILSSEWVRKMWPYMLGIAALMVLYIAHTFQLQKLHLEHQKLVKEVRALDVKAVAKTAERVTATRRSEIVRRLAEKDIPLKEFPNPVKTIDN